MMVSLETCGNVTIGDWAKSSVQNPLLLSYSLDCQVTLCVDESLVLQIPDDAVDHVFAALF